MVVFGVSGKSLSPRSSLRIALPILAGTPRNAPTPARAGILRDRTAGAAAAALGFRSATTVRCVGDSCGFHAHAASADSSRERDHSAGSRSSAGCGRDTGGLRRSDLRRLPPALAYGRSASRRVLCGGSARSPACGTQSPRGCVPRSRCAARAFVECEACPLRAASLYRPASRQPCIPPASRPHPARPWPKKDNREYLNTVMLLNTDS